MTARASRMLAAWASEAVSSMLRGGLVLLLVVDLLFCILHLASWLGLSKEDRFFLDADRGLAEWWQYLQAGVTVFALAVMAARSRQLVYAAWGLVFAYALLDDYGMIHERGGTMLVHFFGLASAFGFRAQDFGELLVSALFGVPLMLLCWWAHKLSRPPAQAHSLQLLWMFAVLLFFGIFVDMAHSVAASAGIGFPGMNTVEDAGELFAMSLATAFSVGVALSTLNRPAKVHSPG